ncbi:MAG TPA: hypothetical protein RMH99_32165 [Sandaracinaceae bacterium LLY-WYZ-13_1]|nr:hypothetical protein [Sandaracinaceae bacterium LLY-WYZ-13_1]
MHRRVVRWVLRDVVVALLALFAVSCGTEPFEVVDRAAEDRTPLTAACDDLDPGRCLLPWPSNRFVEADTATETGLRLAVEPGSLNPRDDAASLSLANGFSRVSPVLAHFEAPLDEGTFEDGVHLIVAQPGHSERGREVPLRIETLSLDDGQTLLLADPREVLPPNADHVVVITDALARADGAPITRPRAVEVALGLDAPASADEAEVAGYHAPTRALLAELGIDATGVRRVWDFTTRSAEDPRRPLEVMRAASLAAVDDGAVTVSIDRVSPSDDEAVAAIVQGRLVGLPTFLDEDRGFFVGPDGAPEARGTAAAPFRIALPAGDGDYRFVMYGHGTGGNERDAAFDDDLAALGIAKVGVRLYGWTDEDVILTFSNLQRAVEGSFGAAAFLVEALAHAAAIERAMTGALGDALSAAELGGVPNPEAGRRPDGSVPMWVGGSLGGTTGLIYAAADPAVRHAVINVPGAAWSQWVWHSITFDLIHDLIGLRYDDDLDLALALSIGQTNLDLADGASWADVLEEHPTAFLIQQSMGDPVLPNPGTEMVAVAAGARHVGGVLEPIVGVEPADEVIEGSGITQFRAPPGDELAVHGFADRDTPAGEAARAQIFEFVTSVYAGEARIAPPASCPEGCDFGG